jgi:hypothetical protein
VKTDYKRPRAKAKGAKGKGQRAKSKERRAKSEELGALALGALPFALALSPLPFWKDRPITLLPIVTRSLDRSTFLTIQY